MEDFYVDISERAGLLEEIYGKGHVEGKQVKFKNKAGDVIEVAITSRAKMDDSGNFSTTRVSSTTSAKPWRTRETGSSATLPEACVITSTLI